jgi:serine protease DegQ
VGINTAIFSRSGGSLGIGFAVPVDTARQVMEQLIAGGKVRRGWIGVEPRDLSAELAESLNLPVRSGVLITGVLQNGPAARGGLRPGDVVRAGGRASRCATWANCSPPWPRSSPEHRGPLVVQRGASSCA